MAKYKLKDATLGSLEGQGYAFTRRTALGPEIKGVFFSDGEHADMLEELAEKEEVEFTGVVYRKYRSGKIKERVKTFVVDVKNLISVRAGERADFLVLAEA